jgi:hypothetical protein
MSLRIEFQECNRVIEREAPPLSASSRRRRSGDACLEARPPGLIQDRASAMDAEPARGNAAPHIRTDSTAAHNETAFPTCSNSSTKYLTVDEDPFGRNNQRTSLSAE